MLGEVHDEDDDDGATGVEYVRSPSSAAVSSGNILV